MLIVYTSDTEVIVTTKEQEAGAIREWFTEGDRDIEAYDREEIFDFAVAVTPTLRVKY